MTGHGLSKTRQRIKYIISDLISSAVAFFLFDIVRYFLLAEFNHGYFSLWEFLFSTKLIIEQILVPICMLVVFWLSGYYNRPFGKSRLQELVTTFFSACLNTVLIYLVLLINDQTGERRINYELIIILFGLLFLLTYGLRIIITLKAISNFKRHQWEFRTLIIGNSPIARATAARLSNVYSKIGYNILGFVKVPGEESIEGGANVFSLENIVEVCREKRVEQLIIASKTYDEGKVLDLLYKLFPLEIPIKISPDTFSFLTSSIRLNDIFAEPFVDLTSPTLSEASKNVKRSFDVLFSIIIILILSPVYLLIAIFIKLDSKGKIFYRQERIGKSQKPFFIYKFRTMVENAEEEGPMLSSSNDTRITRIGKTLRKYRLDELPQFWNVLKGEMSIVGPRPEREFFIKQIIKEAPYYILVYQVRPGITSWGMVKYGYASNLKQMVERTRYDLIYLANMSLFVDMKILIYTVKTIITGKGI